MSIWLSLLFSTVGGRSYPLQLFGIFDGHGGPYASQDVRDHLKGELEKALIEFNPQGLADEGIWKALKLTTVRLNREFKHRFPQIAERGRDNGDNRDDFGSKDLDSQCRRFENCFG